MKKKLLIFCLFCCCTVYGMAQNFVSGTVTDETGAAVPGTTVVLEGTQRGVVSDQNGKYSIEVSKFPAQLTFNFIGYEPQTLTCTKSVANLDVVLKTDMQNIEQVVVVGYGTQKKASVVGAISTASADDLVKAPVGSVGTAMVGRLTGLTTMQTSGQPGAESPIMRIRGVSTLSNASPLVVVDGVERASGGYITDANGTSNGAISGWEGINPNDVESISILKDASATAVYGVKGANGVIIITTKKGISGKASVSYSGNFGLSTPVRMRHNLDSYEWGFYQNEGRYNDGLGSIWSYDDLNRYRFNSNSLLYPSVDYADYMLKKYSPKQSHNLSVRGGGDFVKYFASVGYYDEDGMIKQKKGYGFDPNMHYSRLNLRTNLDFQFTKRFSGSVNLDGRFERRGAPNAPADSQFFWKLYQAHPFISPGFDEENRFILTNPQGQVAPIWNWVLDGGYYRWNQVTANTVFSLKHELDFITEGLSVQAKYSFDSFTDTRYKRKRSFASYQPVDVDGEIYLKKSGEDGPLIYTQDAADKRRKEYFEGGLNYARTFGDHAVTAMALYTQEKSRYYESTFSDVPHAYLGIVGRATYNYKSRYFAEFNIGINGSENFPKGQRFGTFPAYSVGWLMSEESFMKNVKFVSSLKIRGSYGEVGNDRGTTRFLYLSSPFNFYPDAYQLIYGEPGNNSTNEIRPLQEGKSPNNNVTWETAKKYNIGLDAKFFDSRLSLTFDVFKEDRENILTSMKTLPAFQFFQIQGDSGFKTLSYLTDQNYAKVNNKGLEVELGWDATVGNDFYYSIKGTYAYSVNTATLLSETPQKYPWLLSQGRRIGEMRGLIAEGYWDSYEEINDPNNPYCSFGPNPVPGDIKYKDVNGDMIINDYDRIPLGFSNTPRSTFTLSLGFGYKNFEVSALFQGAAGIYYMPQEENQIMMNEGNGGFTWIEDRWTPQTRSGNYPVLHSDNQRVASNFQNSTYWAYDATYVRLKNLEIGYNLPKRWLDRIKIENIRISLTGQNLWTWTPTEQMKHFDPEMIQGRQIFYPVMQVYNIGLNITF